MTLLSAALSIAMSDMGVIHGRCRELGLLPLPAGERGGVRGIESIERL
jgi:hypothetical protein